MTTTTKEVIRTAWNGCYEIVNDAWGTRLQQTYDPEGVDMSDSNGTALPAHPFDLAANWKKPQDYPRYSCQYEADSSPQLIVANFSAAMLTLSVVRALLDDRIPAMILCYNDDKQTLTHEGIKFE